jgi:DNA-binding NtrC family response regulator
MNILLLSADPVVAGIVGDYAKAHGDDLRIASLIREASAVVSSEDMDILILDCTLRSMELIAFTSEAAEHLAETVLLLIGPFDQDQREKLSRRISAHYAIDAPIRKQAFAEVMERVSMRSAIVRKAGLIGKSAVMEETVQTIMQVGPTPITVLITGESGVGKEVIARAIHSVSPRAGNPFLAVNCAALAEGVLESELFGHEKGSFTGAVARRTGMFEKANGGTIFLDEIGEIPPSTQIRLLRVLEEREIMRVGGMESITVDVRIIAATNRDLRDLVEKNAFRRDLYYRIKVLEIDVPPLRNRPEDIPLLIDRMLKRYSRENGLPLRRFDEETKQYLSRAVWPGNVRELRNFVESCLALTTKKVIGLSDIPEHILGEIHRQGALPVLKEKIPEHTERELIYRTLIELKNDLAEIRDLLRRGGAVAPGYIEPLHHMEVVPFQPGNETTLDEMERVAITDALRQTRGNRRRAAKLLGIGERTLYRRLKRYDIRNDDADRQ